MNQQQQQQQVQPDYNYILNQDAPVPTKKRSFKLPIIAGLFLISLLIILVIVAALQGTSPQNVTAKAISQPEAEQINKAYFGYIVDGQTEKAYASFAEDVKKDLNKDTYAGTVVQRLPEVVNFNECVFSDYAPTQTSVTTYKYRCPTKNNEFIMIFNMTLTRHTNGEIRIAKSLIDVEEKKS